MQNNIIDLILGLMGKLNPPRQSTNPIEPSIGAYDPARGDWRLGPFDDPQVDKNMKTAAAWQLFSSPSQWPGMNSWAAGQALNKQRVGERKKQQP